MSRSRRLAGAVITAIGVAMLATSPTTQAATYIDTIVTPSPAAPGIGVNWSVSGSNCADFDDISAGTSGMISYQGLFGQSGDAATGVTPDGSGDWTADLPPITTAGFYRVYGTCDVAFSDGTLSVIYRSQWTAMGTTAQSFVVSESNGSVTASGANCPNGTITVESRLANGTTGNISPMPSTQGNPDGTWSFNIGTVGEEISVLQADWFARCSSGALFYTNSPTQSGGPDLTVPGTEPPTNPPTTQSGGSRGLPQTGGSTGTLPVVAASFLAIGAALLALRSRRTA